LPHVTTGKIRKHKPLIIIETYTHDHPRSKAKTESNITTGSNDNNIIGLIVVLATINNILEVNTSINNQARNNITGIA